MVFINLPPLKINQFKWRIFQQKKNMSNTCAGDPIFATSVVCIKTKILTNFYSFPAKHESKALF